MKSRSVRSLGIIRLRWRGSIVLFIAEIVTNLFLLLLPLTYLGWLRSSKISDKQDPVPMWVIDLWVLILIAYLTFILCNCEPANHNWYVVSCVAAGYCLIDVAAAVMRDMVMAPIFHVDEDGGFMAVRDRRRWILLSLLNVIQVVLSFSVLIFAHGNDFNEKIVDPLTALYFAAITFTSVGYGDFRPITGTSKLIILTELVFFVVFLLIKIPTAVSMVRVKQYR